MTINFPPALIFLIGAAALLALPSRWRRWVFIAVPAFVVAQNEWWLPLGTRMEFQWLGATIIPLTVDRVNDVFGDVFAMVAVLGGIYAFHLEDRRQQVATLVYGGCALGVVYAGDLLSLVMYWEVMAVASSVLVFTGDRPESKGAGIRYLFVHIVGGSLLLAGVFWHVGGTGSLVFEQFAATPAAWLILGGFAVNAAIPPLHAWLSDGYPESSITGMVFLSAFTTKTAVYALSRGFLGWELLLPVGVAMALYGMIFAVMEDDIRRLLAYHIISQVGFMVAGLGMASEEARLAAASHAFTHVLYKALLIMGAGAVVYATGRSRLSELGGLAPRMKAVFVLYMVGALSISAFPAFAGFVSKPLITTAVKEAEELVMAFGLYVASVGTFLHTGLKLPYFTFFGDKRAGEVPILRKIPPGMYLAMGMAAALNILIGIAPDWLYQRLHFEIHPEPYSVANVVHTFELLIFTALAFWAFKGFLKGERAIIVDTDWFYRRAGRPVARLVTEPLTFLFGAAGSAVQRLTRVTTYLTWGAGRETLTERRIPAGMAIALIVLTASLVVLWSLLR